MKCSPYTCTFVVPLLQFLNFYALFYSFLKSLDYIVVNTSLSPVCCLLLIISKYICCKQNTYILHKGEDAYLLLLFKCLIPLFSYNGNIFHSSMTVRKKINTVWVVTALPLFLGLKLWHHIFYLDGIFILHGFESITISNSLFKSYISLYIKFAVCHLSLR